MPVVYDEKKCEPGRHAARWFFPSLAVGLLAVTAAIGLEIASGHGEGKADGGSFEEIAPENAVMSEGIIQGFLYENYERLAKLAEERAHDTGEQADIAACQAAVDNLATVAIGPPEIDCNP